jgi:RNA polymerase sigma-54 factor
MIPNRSQTLEIKSSQSLVMSESLQQSIKLLQLSTLELNNFITSQLESNPLLNEKNEENDSSLENSEEERLLEIAAYNENQDNDYDAIESDHQLNNKLDGDFQNNLRYESASSTKSSNHKFENDFDIENNPSNKTLKEHVLEQIYLGIRDPFERIIAFNITDLLTDSGYIEGDLIKLAANIGVNFAKLEEVLSHLQNFEPAGIFARNLAECLSLQLRDKNYYNEQFAMFLQHLPLLAEGKIDELRKICKISDKQLSNMIRIIKELNPKPGSDFVRETTYYMIPEVFVRKEKDRFIIELNNEILPKLLIDRHYYSEVRKKTTNKEQQKYLSDQLYTANWLIKSLDQRAQTILRVATEIVAFQQDFFNNGIMHLKPMTLKMIAEKLNLHESTISRVTTNKFMSTTLGFFEMKYLFSSSLEADDAQCFSSTTVKYIIKDLILKESSILSDQSIVEILNEQNINLARRTVSKYREELKIPSSSMRRKEKRIK